MEKQRCTHFKNNIHEILGMEEPFSSLLFPSFMYLSTVTCVNLAIHLTNKLSRT